MIDDHLMDALTLEAHFLTKVFQKKEQNLQIQFAVVKEESLYLSVSIFLSLMASMFGYVLLRPTSIISRTCSSSSSSSLLSSATVEFDTRDVSFTLLSATAFISLSSATVSFSGASLRFRPNEGSLLPVPPEQ